MKIKYELMRKNQQSDLHDRDLPLTIVEVNRGVDVEVIVFDVDVNVDSDVNVVNVLWRAWRERGCYLGWILSMTER